jgi:hypothetical protein
LPAWNLLLNFYLGYICLIWLFEYSDRKDVKVELVLVLNIIAIAIDPLPLVEAQEVYMGDLFLVEGGIEGGQEDMACLLVGQVDFQ